jgi:hypothetical protein
MKKILFVFAFAILTMFAVSCDFGTGSNSANIDTLEVNCDTTICVADTVETDTLVQCKGITKKGTQCERLVSQSEEYCFQHVGQKQQQ